MSVEQLTEGLQSKRDENERVALAEYAALVKDVHAGRIRSDDDDAMGRVDAVLQAAGRSADDLLQDVGHIRTRESLEILLATEPESRAESKRASQARTAAEAEYNAAVKRWEADKPVLDGANAKASKKLRDIRLARRRLEREYPGSDVGKAYAAEQAALPPVRMVHGPEHPPETMATTHDYGADAPAPKAGAAGTYGNGQSKPPGVVRRL